MDGRDFQRTCICESFEEMCVPLNEVGSKTDVLFSEIASLRAKLEAAERERGEERRELARIGLICMERVSDSRKVENIDAALLAFDAAMGYKP